MLKKVLPLLLAMSLASAAMAFSFSAEASSGQTLYFTITEGNTVKVVAPATVSWTGYTTPTGQLVIPSTVTSGGTTYTVTAIDKMAFLQCYELTAVTVPGTVVTIGMRAFAEDTLLATATLSEGVQRIDMMAFFMCSSLATINLPTTLQRIAVSAFEGTAFYTDEATWNDSMLTLGNWVIKVGNLVEGTVSVPEGMTGVANNAFMYCRYMNKVELPSTMLYIGEGAFKDCYGLDTVRVRALMPPAISDDSFQGVNPLPTLAVPFGRASVYDTTQYWRDFNIVEDRIKYISIDEVATTALTVCAVEGGIMVCGAEGACLAVYDMMGRRVAVSRNAVGEQYLLLPTTGVYVLQANGRAIKLSYCCK